MSASVRLHAWVCGRVQGVGYRHFAWTEARRLDVAGWVRNEADGRVQVVAEGEKAALDDLLAALHRGPSWARVQDVEASWKDATGEFSTFDVRR